MVERCVNRLKQWRSVATRYEKWAVNYRAMVVIASLMRWLHIGSVGRLFTAPFSGAYHMSKYAVESLSDAMRAEVAGFGVEVVLLEPTGVHTPFVHKQVATTPDTGLNSPYAAQKTAGEEGAVALFREGSRAVVDPEEVAKVVGEGSMAVTYVHQVLASAL